MKTIICLCILLLGLITIGCSGRSSPRVGQKIVFVAPTSVNSQPRELGYYRGTRFLVSNITDVSGDTIKFMTQYGTGGEIQLKSLDGMKLNYKVIHWIEDTPDGYLIENPEQKPQAEDVIIGTNNVLEKAYPRTFWAFYVYRIEDGKPAFVFRDIESSAMLSKEDWNRMGRENLDLREYVVAPSELKNKLCGKVLGCNQ